MTERSEHLETFIRESIGPKCGLLIENDHDLCSLVQRNSDHLRVNWDVAFTGEEGVDRSYEKAYDFVFVDLRLPVMTGSEVIKRIRPRNKKIVVFTGYPDSHDMREAMREGAILMAIKPDVISPEYMENLLSAFGVTVKQPKPNQ